MFPDNQYKVKARSIDGLKFDCIMGKRKVTTLAIGRSIDFNESAKAIVIQFTIIYFWFLNWSIEFCGMKRYGYTILWQDKGDLKWQDLVPRLVFLSNLESPPSVLVVHCGGNSIDQTPLFDLRAEINFSLNQIKVMFPETKLVWSQILPRSNWRYSENM